MGKLNKTVDTNTKRLLSKGFTPVQVLQMKELAKKEGEAALNRAKKETFLLMLAIPVCTIAEDYWPKTAHERVPKLIEDCLDLYDSVEKGVVSMEELWDYLKKYGGSNYEVIRQTCNRD